jgi:hypothetical protein
MKTTKVILLLDASASMRSIAKSTVRAFNAVLASIKNSGIAQAGQRATAALYFFGDDTRPVNRVFFDAPIGTVQPLRENEYHPNGGSTPMFDGVGTAIEDALALPTDDDTAFVLNVITDGENNAAYRFNAQTVKKLMDKVQGTDHWTITFLVPVGKKNALIRNFGIPEGNIQEWEQTDAGVEQMGQALSSGYQNYAQLRSQGKTSTAGFFTTNLTNLSAGEVRKNLKSVTMNFTELGVDSRAPKDIRSFVEYKGFTFVKGHAYYQLTKDELVQERKEMLVQNLKSGAIYGGPEARQLLGLPVGQRIKVRPGNHAKYRIFVQSTSTNRKLVSGTSLMLKIS